MTVWTVVLVVIGYAIIATVVGTLLSAVSGKPRMIEDQTDAKAFAYLCGVFWPISPVFLVCLVIHKLLVFWLEK